MRLLERFQFALGSHLGIVFTGLLIGLVLLALAYWVLIARQKRRDLLAYLHRSYYEKVQGLAKDFAFVGSHKAEFFGRQSVVKFHQGAFGVCLVPPPGWVDQDVKERFGCFHRAKEHVRLPGFASVLWRNEEPALAVIEGKLLDGRGRLLPTLRQHLFDKKLALTSREQILLEIATALSNLHEQRVDQGDHLYHGFLLPRSILVDIDPNHRINGVVISGAGIPYAMGPEHLLQQLIALKEGKLPIEKYCAQEILEQVVFLAPEQKHPERLHEVGPAADFFAFGAIAVSLLTQQRFVSPAHIDWSRLPQLWVSFLKMCLTDDPDKRPEDFMELEDWLNDPELALTHRQTEEVASVLPRPSTENVMATMIRRSHTDSEVSGDVQQHLAEGLKAIKASKWQVAKKSLSRVLAEDPGHASAHAHMAIACFELDEKKKAESHYDKAKKADPMAAKTFRQHLAFRL